MKLANYFYMADEDAIFSMFREVFRPLVPDAAVAQLVQRCLQEIAPGVQLCEWFLMESRPLQITENSMPMTITANIYLKSSDDSMPLIEPPDDGAPPLAIGFSAIARPRTISLWVDL